MYSIKLNGNYYNFEDVYRLIISIIFSILFTFVTIMQMVCKLDLQYLGHSDQNILHPRILLFSPIWEQTFLDFCFS